MILAGFLCIAATMSRHRLKPAIFNNQTAYTNSIRYFSCALLFCAFLILYCVFSLLIALVYWFVLASLAAIVTSLLLVDTANN
jgi:hypothetical protein